MSERVYRSVIRTALGLFRVLDFQFAIEGWEHIPDSQGAVLASNHVSFFDFMFVGLAAYQKDRLVRFMAKQSVFDAPAAGWLMRQMKHIPVDRSAGAAAYGEAVAALRRGELVGVFPESTISRSFVPRTFKSGSARMALEAGVPILPTVVWGGQRVWTAGRKPSPHRHVPVTIRVGPAVDCDGQSPVQVAQQLHDAVRAMTEDVQRSYPDCAIGAGQWWQPAYLGGGAATPEAAAERDLAAIRRPARKRRSRGGA